MWAPARPRTASAGSALAAVEGWQFGDGFWLVVKELSGTDSQLVPAGDSVAPASPAGKLAAAFVGVVSIAVFAGVLAVMGGGMVVTSHHLRNFKLTRNVVNATKFIYFFPHIHDFVALIS